MQSRTTGDCVHFYNIEISNPFNLELELINSKPVVKKQIRRCVKKLKMFKIQSTLILEYKL